MDKTYRPADVEDRIYARWEAESAFASGRGADGNKTPYTIVIPPPNVTGSLHMGHALNNTLQDILIRYARMTGRDALWQPGTDHAGIATQMVVERKLMEAQQPDRRALGRAEFLKLKEQDRARLIEVDWGSERRKAYPVDLRIIAYDRQGLLRDISQVMADQDINVLAVNTRSNKEDNTATMQLTIEIPGLDALGRLLARVSQLPNIIEARRNRTP